MATAPGTGTNSLVVKGFAAWAPPGGFVIGSLSYLMGTTWLAMDPLGGASGYSGVSNPGPPLIDEFSTPPAPLVTGHNGEWLGGDNDGLQDDGSAIVGGAAGAAWGPGPSMNFSMDSEVSLVNGASVDSVFIGHFAPTDPSATLVGGDILSVIDGVNTYTPLDGSPGTGGYSLAYERGVTSLGAVYIDMFIVVPTPGVAGLLGIAGLAAVRRRRRESAPQR